MIFETNNDVLQWYEKQPRAVTDDFVCNINWSDVKRFPLDKKFVPVLVYMRDVETLTEVYHQQLMRTPTGKDKIIGKFMERWGTEELTHGELLNRFLNEAGFETEKNWKNEAKRDISWSYRLNTYITTMLTNCFGRKFTGVHMTYGAINEMCTLQGYRRLIELADHPVLTRILKAIMREESVHTQFYWSVAKIELMQSAIAQKLARFVINKFWVPVGQGIKTEEDSNYTVATLFGDQKGMEWVDRNITQRIRQLPGFDKLNKINETVSRISDLEIV
jgi:Fatty acid desaturase